ncbi:MAG TPA: accessory factor UbiK family protein [Acetobacteraceae bacterium]|jgi:BMFP domain-containing protein YqiC|nr:accessory factor UbiK family protein [Acetobacteraceae bacterium]
MGQRPPLFDDLAGVAGGAFSALAGIREETEAALRSRLEDLVRRLDVASRPDLEAVKELAANARTASEDASASLARLAERLDALEARIAALEKPRAPEA